MRERGRLLNICKTPCIRFSIEKSASVITSYSIHYTKLYEQSKQSLDGLEGQPGTLKGVVRRVEERMIREALETSGGNQTKAAKKLGLSRQG